MPSQITNRRRGAGIILAIFSIVFLLGTGAAQRAQAGTTTLTFDEFTSGTTLTTQYQSLGVTADGTTIIETCAICSYPALSGSNVAYSLSGSMTFTFDSSAIGGNVQTVSAYVTDYYGGAGIYAYDTSGDLLGQSVMPAPGESTFLSFTSPGVPIAYVTVHDAGSQFTIDNFSFTWAPSTFSVLHSFNGADGAIPLAGLVMNTAGNLYGTTSGGGDYTAGTVFKLDTSGNESVLYSFTGGADGGAPKSDLLIDAAGNLYGTAYSGRNSCFGTAYKVDATGNESVLHCFLYYPDDGADPDSGLAMDATGTLYGATPDGGKNLQGILFKLNPLNEETILHSFSGSPDDGESPEGIAMDKEGNVYGTTIYGGSSTACFAGCGAVFEFYASGTEKTLYSFTAGTDGELPWAAPIVDENGNIYGTTSQGGGSANCSSGCGTVFEVNASSDESVLYSFKGGTDGRSPRASLTRDAEGNLYGTTLLGGDTAVNNGTGYGTVFKLDSSGSETVLYRFTGGDDGRFPVADLLLDAAGNIYGTAQSGGKHGKGTVFKISVPSEQALPNMTDYVKALYSQGALTSGQDNSLVKEIQKAIDMSGKGKINGAIGNLESLITEVEDLESSGVLTPSQAGALISAANGVIAQLQTP